MAEMDDYDALPSPIRAWLAGCDEDWQVATVMGYWKIWQGSVEQFVSFLKEEAG